MIIKHFKAAHATKKWYKCKTIYWKIVTCEIISLNSPGERYFTLYDKTS